jgi:Spy/CpxP family protein refolding chaperone
MKRGWLASLLAAAVVLPMAAHGADDTKTPQTPPAKTPADTTTALKGRLPPYYAKLSIDATQKTKIYEIEASFTPKLKALHEQLEALEAEQRDQIKAVLTPEQQDKLKTLIAEARAGNRHEKAPTETASPSTGSKTTPSSPATTTPSPATTSPTPAPPPK